MVSKVQPKHGNYYDLIKLPHGHIPAPLSNFWSSLPLPVRDVRTYNYYRCPECGTESFFKIERCCRNCEDFMFDCATSKDYKKFEVRVRRRQRRRYFKQLLKQVEYWFLPVLVLFGEAWYVKSDRLHWRDIDKGSHECPCYAREKRCETCPYLEQCGGCTVYLEDEWNG